MKKTSLIDGGETNSRYQYIVPVPLSAPDTPAEVDMLDTQVVPANSEADDAV